MCKTFSRIFLAISFFIITLFLNESVFATPGTYLKIITREERGAQESYRYADSKVWVDYYKNQEKKEDKKTEAQKKADAEKREKRKAIDDYLVKNFSKDYEYSEIITEENGHDLIRPIRKSKNKKAIVIHHTDTDSTDSYAAIKSIYKYHTLSRARGDIGYNYLIGLNGEIFEGRAGGDYAVGAHVLRNNHSTIGISVIGKYDDKEININQYNSLKNLIKYLGEKHNIDFNGKYHYHIDCNKNCSFYVKTYEDDTVIGHRDSGNTKCPGEKLYKQLQELKKELRNTQNLGNNEKKEVKKTTSSKNINSKLSKRLDKFSEYDLLRLLALIEYKIDKKGKSDILNKLKNIVKSKIKVNEEKTSKSDENFDKNNKIKIKLSYPHKDFINIKKGNKTYHIKLKNGKLLVENKLELEKVNLKSDLGGYLEISSWNRKPSWDKENKYNDNKFRGEIILYIKNGEIVVVNEVNISDYLKGLGEVSDLDNTEKIKTIIIAARTYAKWYTEKARKFPGEFYDGTDNPDEFQIYLGYELEKRSPNINKIVDETKDKIITYNGKLIKSWYFSQSSGKTLSYKTYCKQKNTKCDNGIYPFLVGIFDPAGIGKTKKGHGVGISGIGATYFAQKGWTNEMIIKYYLKGVEVK